jgi:hypothetical protein
MIVTQEVSHRVVSIIGRRCIMAGLLTHDQAARDRAKQELEEAQRKMAEEIGGAMPVATSEEEADKIAVEWEKCES